MQRNDKKHEEVIRGSISEILSKVSSRDIKGEICLVIEGDKDLIEPSIDLDNEIKDLILRKCLQAKPQSF